jgi:peptidoglycan/LPS O-acetylase OafA/YrhL
MVTSPRTDSSARDLPEPRHKPELDGIRGIAILAVLLSHAGPYIRLDGFVSDFLVHVMVPGWFGVDLFFVLSGFLITGILLRTRRAENYFSSFYMRRFLRIFPIYYCTLTALLVIAHFSPFWHAITPKTLMSRISYYFYLQNCPLFWDYSRMSSRAVGHFWSLAVEEQFYFIWPILIWRLPDKVIFRICCAGLILAPPLRIFLFYKYFGADFGLMQLTTSRMDGLLIGSALAIQSKKGPIPLWWSYSEAAVGGIIISYIALFHRSELISTDKFMPTIGVAGFALLSGALLGFSQRSFSRLLPILNMRWLRLTGKYSYGMYIYHVPLYIATGRIFEMLAGASLPLPTKYALPYIAVLIAVTFVMAKLSFDLFESRILQFKRYFKPEATLTPNHAVPASAND